jgi:transposase-like protein
MFRPLVGSGRGDEDELAEDEREELKRLRKENKLLRIEKDILKKASAFFAKERGVAIFAKACFGHIKALKQLQKQ